MAHRRLNPAYGQFGTDLKIRVEICRFIVAFLPIIVVIGIQSFFQKEDLLKN
jgi:hypothetical protein